MYVVGALEIRAGRPGKEAARQKPNLEDTFPAIFEGRRDLGFTPSLETYFAGVYGLAVQDHRAGQLSGALLYRSIHLLDHAREPGGPLRWTPDLAVLAEVHRRTPTIDIETAGVYSG